MNRKILLLVSAAAGVALLLWLTREIPYCGWDFRTNLWGPVSMLVRHTTPYALETPYGPYSSVWMPPILGFFFYFGYFPCDPLQKIWLLVEVAGMLASIWMIADQKLPSPGVLGLCLVGFFLYPPLWFHIILGQFSMLFVTLMMVAVYLPRTRRFWPLFLALGLTKPQLAIFVYPGLVISVWRKEGFRQAAGMVISTAGLAALFTAPLFVFSPSWLNDFLFVTVKNFANRWDLPTLFVQLPVRMGAAGYGVWALAFLAALAASLWLWWKKDPKTALVASLALTPLATMYASSWDFVLLIPAFFWLVIKLRAVAARAVLLLGMASMFIIQVAERLDHPVQDGTQWWISPALIFIYLASLAVDTLAGQKWFSARQRMARGG